MLTETFITSLLPSWLKDALLLDVSMPTMGTIHQTRILVTTQGRYVLRAYRYSEEQRERVVCEHALVSYAREQGIPAIIPLRLLSGETALEHEGRYYALYPFAPGQQVSREGLGERELWAMGRCLAQLHDALCVYPCAQVTQRNFRFDAEVTFQHMARVEEAICARQHMCAQDQAVLGHLEERRSWLLEHPDDPFSIFDALPKQVIHGDYQEANLFFEQGKVCALIDWDQAYSAPRGWEVVRVLDIVCHFQAKRCRAFLEGYRSRASLLDEEFEPLIACYGWMRMHNLWIYEEVYIEGNERVRRFIPERMLSASDQWASVRDRCTGSSCM